MSRRSKLALMAGVTALCLTGCAGLRPGVAAEVGDSTISMQRLDEFAEGLCAYTAGTASGPAPVADTRRSALGLLVRAELAHQFADSYRSEVDQGEIDRVIRENVAPVVADMPEEERQAFLDDVRESIEGDQLAGLAATDEVESSGGEVSQEAINAASIELFKGWADEAGVELDPRFGTWGDLDVEAGSGSLSVPVGDEPDTSLPGSRTCS